MKQTLFLILIAFISLGCEYDVAERDVPSIVVNALKLGFPNTNDREWEKTAEYYIVEFENDADVDYKVKLDGRGNILMYKYELSKDQLPKTVQDSISIRYPNAEIDELEVLYLKRKKYYQIEMEKSFKDLKKVVDLKGQVTEIPYWD
ncbi:PepSY-like domain-containing protein [Marixanthomonas spongiae]|nr:PepSY-like domain-containing protein [Marixanthomonas spongiae]